MLIEALELERARVVALCGAGGKTTLMFALAQELAATGQRVLVTTTTKMASAEAEYSWPEGVVLSYRAKLADGQKLIGHSVAEIERLNDSGRFDRVLVEADGSAGRPLKAPAAHEPVVPATADAVVIVAGLSGLGRPLSEGNVFRAPIWAALSGTALGSAVDAESFVSVALHKDGLGKGCPVGSRTTLFLNQVHSGETRAAAATIARLIAASGRHSFAKVVSGHLCPSTVIEFA